MANVVEQELSENVRSLNTYIKDTSDFLLKLNNISQPLPNETIMLYLEVKALYPNVPRIETTKTIST